MNNKTKSILLFISKATTIGINLISMMLISRYLTINQYSDYRQILTALTLVISVASVGLPSSILYFITPTQKNEYLPSLYISFAGILVLLIPLSVVGLFYFDFNFNTHIFTGNSIVFISLFLLSFLGACIENLFVSCTRFKLVLLNASIPNLIYALGLIYCFMSGKGISFLVYSLVLREVFRLFLLLYFITTTKVNMKNVKFNRVKEIIFFSIPIGISGLVSTLNTNLDKLITGKFLSKHDFAVIATASYEIPVLGLIGLSLFNILVPSIKEHFKENNLSEIIKLWDRAGKVMITVILPITVAFIVFGKEVVIVLFSQKYLDSVNLFKLYQINALTRIYYYSSFFLALGLNKLYTKNAIINLINNAILNIVLVHFLGVLGTALANVISAQLLVVIQNHQISRSLKVKALDIFPLFDFIKGLFLSFGISYLVYGLYSWIFNINIYFALGFMCLSIIASIIILNLFINNEIILLVIKMIRKLKRGKYAV